MLKIEFNGRTADVADVHRVATWNYGHFTSLQVRAGAVRGLRLHLDRLAHGTRDLLGPEAEHDDERILTLLRHAIRSVPAASVRISVVPAPDAPSLRTDVMVSVSDPVEPNPTPLRVRTVTYERELPHLKHAATLGLSYQWQQALRTGHDDALFLGRDGRIREGSVWNIAFWDGTQVVWPEAPVLPGITMQLLQSALPSVTRPLTLADLPTFTAAAAVNSHAPSRPLAAIDSTAFADPTPLTTALDAAWATVPWDAI